jgi:YidC/Oxa1 family membrane protein insertase
VNPLRPIEELLTWLLEWFHTTLNLPWAWAIVALTVLVRVLLVPLTVRQIHSMQSLQRHMPEMKQIQQKYKGDRQRLNEELMKFYKENKINPAASCLPILAQIPIFFALFFVLRDFKEEVWAQYQTEGESIADLGWLNLVPDITANINAHWSGYLLIGVYLVSQLTSSYFMSAQMQTAQRVLLIVLPIVFVPFIIDPPGSTVFPVGLLIYWVTTNLWTTGQGLVTRRLMPKPAPPPKRSSRTPPRGGDDAGDGAPRPEGGPKPSPAQARPVRKVKRKKKARR